MKSPREKLAAAALGGSMLLLGAGGAYALTGLAGAQDTPTTTQAQAAPSQGQTQTQPQRGNFDPSKGGHQFNGKTEELLTGDNAEKAKAAALKAVPGATIERVETDAEGDAYEAHVVKSDGSHAVVKFDDKFNVTKTESGHGGGR